MSCSLTSSSSSSWSIVRDGGGRGRRHVGPRRRCDEQVFIIIINVDINVIINRVIAVIVILNIIIIIIIIIGIMSTRGIQHKRIHRVMRVRSLMMLMPLCCCCCCCCCWRRRCRWIRMLPILLPMSLLRTHCVFLLIQEVKATTHFVTVGKDSLFMLSSKNSSFCRCFSWYSVDPGAPFNAYYYLIFTVVMRSHSHRSRRRHFAFSVPSLFVVRTRSSECVHQIVDDVHARRRVLYFCVCCACRHFKFPIWNKSVIINFVDYNMMF
jgi:hypothetical protein